jgi:hypothetical protein
MKFLWHRFGQVIVLVLLMITETNAQGFPYDDFLPRTLREIVASNVESQKDIKQHATKTQIIIDADPLPSVVRVTYSGKARPIPGQRRNYLKLWISAMGKKPEFIDLYDQEMLIKEDSTDYWLPVQKQLIPHFREEISDGQAVDLYLLRLGGQLVGPEWDWMFIIEEFRKPGSENPGIFPWNDFEARTFHQLIELGLKEQGSVATKNPQYLFRAEIMSSKIPAIYTGESRPLTEARKKFIEDWAAALGADPAYGQLYEREMLFKEDKSEYWVPVAKMITPRLERDVKKGAELNLYLITLGGLKTESKIDWIFLVEEFRKVKD